MTVTACVTHSPTALVDCQCMKQTRNKQAVGVGEGFQMRRVSPDHVLGCPLRDKAPEQETVAL